MKQFTVGQRTLLDVLDARNELFQSSGLMVTAKVNEVIAAERLLALAGKLNEGLQMDPQLFTASNR
jgi:adhesin transport system outer membrane protein